MSGPDRLEDPLSVLEVMCKAGLAEIERLRILGTREEKASRPRRRALRVVPTSDIDQEKAKNAVVDLRRAALLRGDHA